MNEVMQIRMASWTTMDKQRNDSGLTIKEWCAANGIRESVYYYRLNRLRKMTLDTCEVSSSTETNGQPSTKFARIPVTPASPMQSIALRICCGDMVVEVSSTAPDRILSFLKEVMTCVV